MEFEVQKLAILQSGNKKIARLTLELQELTGNKFDALYRDERDKFPFRFLPDKWIRGYLATKVWSMLETDPQLCLLRQRIGEIKDTLDALPAGGKIRISLPVKNLLMGSFYGI